MASVILPLIFALQPGGVSAANTRHRVLIIYSFDDLLPWQTGVRTGLQERLAEIAPSERPDVFEERVDSARIDHVVSGTALATYLAAKYAALKFDVVIAESAAATSFLLGHVDLFPEAQRFAVDPVASEVQGGDQDQIRLVSTQGDWARRALDNTIQVLPNLGRLIAIVDHSGVGAANKRSLLAAASTLPAGVALEVWDDFTFEELPDRVKALPADSAILYAPVFTDRMGATAMPRAVLKTLLGVASVPILASHDTFLGTGILGGRLLSSRREGNMIADLALGAPYAQAWAHPEERLNPLMFDDAALTRWTIPTSRLPAGAEIVGRDVPAWWQYRWEIGFTAVAFLGEGALILWLVTALRQRDTAVLAVGRERDGLEVRVAVRTRELLAATRRLEETNARLEDLAGTDPLTAIANRRKFLRDAEAAVDRAQREGRPLSVLMLDIDWFKSINDRHGHAAGDQVIRAVADACRSQMGPRDCVGRLGGEEFAVLIPESGAGSAAATAERIRGFVETLRIDVQAGDPVSLTVSIGASSLRLPPDTLDEVLGRADAALYRAKRGGRNRVVTDARPMTDAVSGPALERSYCA